MSYQIAQKFNDGVKEPAKVQIRCQLGQGVIFEDLDYQICVSLCL